MFSIKYQLLLKLEIHYLYHKTQVASESLLKNFATGVPTISFILFCHLCFAPFPCEQREYVYITSLVVSPNSQSLVYYRTDCQSYKYFVVYITTE